MVFKRKHKVTVEELCIYFYELKVFSEGKLELLERSFRYFTELCPLPPNRASQAHIELCALQTELFILALHYYVLRLSQEERPLDLQIASTKIPLTLQMNFTKDYLSYKKLSNVWEAISNYNETIGSSFTENLATDWWGRRRTNDTAIKFESEADWQDWIEHQKTFTRQMRKDSAEGAYDDDCVRRIMNIAVTNDDSWHNGIIPQTLTLKLAERLGCAKDLSTEAFMRLERIVLGLYNTAKDFVEAKPFRKEYQRDVANLFESMRQLLEEIRKHRHLNTT